MSEMLRKKSRQKLSRFPACVTRWLVVVIESTDEGPGCEGKQMNLVLNMLCLEVPLGHLRREVQKGIKYKRLDLWRK